MPLAAAPLELIREQSAQAHARQQPLSLGPLARERQFVCPTLTPLYYAPIYQELSPAQQLRYNQLTALSFNELIAYFEQQFAASVLAASARLQQTDPELATCLQGFLDEEREHVAYWQRLNALSEPEWYAGGGRQLLRICKAAEWALRFFTRRPAGFPVVFWVMLALEERSLEISRRCLRMYRDQIDPNYREVYRQHLVDEVRHVQLDCHLIACYFDPLPPAQKQRNAWLLRQALGRFLLPPNRTAVRVIKRWLMEHPELEPCSHELLRQLREVGHNAEFHALNFSRETTPVLFALFDRYPQMHTMERVLLSYHPQLDVREGSGA